MSPMLCRNKGGSLSTVHVEGVGHSGWKDSLKGAVDDFRMNRALSYLPLPTSKTLVLLPCVLFTNEEN